MHAVASDIKILTASMPQVRQAQKSARLLRVRAGAADVAPPRPFLPSPSTPSASQFRAAAQQATLLRTSAPPFRPGVGAHLQSMGALSVGGGRMLENAQPDSQPNAVSNQLPNAIPDSPPDDVLEDAVIEDQKAASSCAPGPLRGMSSMAKGVSLELAAVTVDM
ncbi:unnamed protein product [Prorocentrum cordatum]|uniref:Uncharacterized protein n=1 Tax=Prorocentrum cordatum TaxID=2364126 RepID=A0ABN9PBD1_9DINO|nr:unnamed protein product [Polarella glacialis]